MIVGRFLKGRYYHGKPVESRLQVISMFTEQVPDMDMSRGLAAEHGFKLVPTIRQALTLTSDSSKGPRELAVDGVVIICEHGTYPYNSLGQKMYPRYEFFKEVVDVFVETGKTVPVFTDKHLSYDWHKAKWMYDQSRSLGFPLMAGSVLPHANAENITVAPGVPIEKAVVTWQANFVGNKDSYGFHALERLQSVMERRAGGETGIAAVQCFEGEPVWEWTDNNKWAEQLLQAVTSDSAQGSPALREQVKNPMVFVLYYKSGLQAAVYRLNGLRTRQAFAIFERGRSEPVLPVARSRPAAIAVPQDLRRRYRNNHFSAQVDAIEKMILTGHTPNPVERTLLTTGALAALFQSSYRPSPMYGKTMQHGTLLERGQRIETPHLHISYDVSKG